MPDFYSDVVIEHNGQTLLISTLMIETTAMTEPDPMWVWTDDAGHQHTAEARDDGTVVYPTLEIVNAAAAWCPNCQAVHPDVWFECRECRQKTLPGVRPGQLRLIPGPRVYLIDDDEVTEEQANAFYEAHVKDFPHHDHGDPFGMLVVSLDHGTDLGGLPGMGGDEPGGTAP